MRHAPSLLGALLLFGFLGCASTAGVRTQPNDARLGVTCEAILAMMHMETSPQLGRYGEKLAGGCRDESDGTPQALVQVRLSPGADREFQRTPFPSCQDDMFIVAERSPRTSRNKSSSEEVGEGVVDALVLDIVSDGNAAAFKAVMVSLDPDGNHHGFYLCGFHAGSIDLKTLAPVPEEATAHLVPPAEEPLEDEEEPLDE